MQVPQHLQEQRAGEAVICQPRLDKGIYFPGSNWGSTCSLCKRLWVLLLQFWALPFGKTSPKGPCAPLVGARGAGWVRSRAPAGCGEGTGGDSR